jgi:hypothetical protein
VTRIPGGPPQQDVLEAAVRAGRRRRRREATWAGGAALALVAGVLGAALTGTGGRPGSLEQIPADRPPGVLTAASPTSPGPGTSPVRQAPTGPAREPANGAAVTKSAQPSPAVSGEPIARPVGTSGPRAYRESPGYDAGYTQYCDAFAAAAGTPPGTQMCAQSDSPPSVRSGEAINVVLLLCNSLSSPRPVTVSFDQGREHEIAVRSADGDIWTWSRPYVFPQGPHSRVVQSGYCFRWANVWDTRDDAGRLVPPGNYTVETTLEISGDRRRFTTPLEVQPS